MATRMAAIDLDGTLLRSDGSLSRRTQTALEMASGAGWEIMIVTARPPRFVQRLASSAGLSGHVICCNGALVYDLDTGRIERHVPITSDAVAELVERLRVELPDVRFAVERGLEFGWEPDYVTGAGDQYASDVGAIISDVVTLCQQPVTKLIVQHRELHLDELLTLVQSASGGALQVTQSGAPFIEVSAAGVHKAGMVAQMANEHDVKPAGVVAFGDMPNDIPMLRWAGRAVAMANAHLTVKAEADEVTLSNDEDGVAVVLERLVRAGQVEGRAAC